MIGERHSRYPCTQRTPPPATHCSQVTDLHAQRLPSHDVWLMLYGALVLQVKNVQIQLGDKQFHVTAASSHVMHQEPDMRAANVRNLRNDGIRTAGLARTTLPYFNVVPGVGGDDPRQGRCVFDAFDANSNKFRDTRRFAQMNNPRIPRNNSYNPLTGAVAPTQQAPSVELFPRNPVRPPLASLGQMRPSAPDAVTTFLESRPF